MQALYLECGVLAYVSAIVEYLNIFEHDRNTQVLIKTPVFYMGKKKKTTTTEPNREAQMYY